MTDETEPPEPAKKQENYYLRRLSGAGKKLFDLLLGAVFFLIVDWIARFVLSHMGVSAHDEQGKQVWGYVNYCCLLVYFVYLAHLLVPDASEQLAEAWNRTKAPWKRRGKSADEVEP